MIELKRELKSGKFKPVYLLYGSESYLLRLYCGELEAAIPDKGAEMMNLDIFEGKDVSALKIIDAANTVPFFSEYRLVICKDTRLFVTGRKDESEKIIDYLPALPDTTVLAFVETEVDKRGRLYKRVAERGRAVEFKLPSEKDLIDWISRTLRKAGMEISPMAAAYLLRNTPTGMDNILAEMEKLISYKAGSGEVAIDDIDAVCSKSMETRIFELVDAVGTRRPDKALDIFGNMLIMKESPIMVITMLARQFRLLSQCKYLLEKKTSHGEIAGALGLQSFLVKGYLKQSENFNLKQLLDAYDDCVEADIAVKTGRIGDALAVETIIIKHSGMQ